MSLVSCKLDPKDVQDILSEVYEQSQRNQTMNAQEVVKTMVTRLNFLLHDDMDSN